MNVFQFVVLVLWVGLAHVEAQTCGDPNRGNCTLLNLIGCNVKSLTQCPIGTVPTYTDCCPSCLPNPCITCDVSALPVCADGAMPTLTNGCPNCKPHLSSTCTLSELPPCQPNQLPKIVSGCPDCRYSCNYDSLLPCPDGEEPVYNGYCPSCNKFVPCLTKCLSSLGSIRTCAHQEIPAYDPATCCITCVVRNFCNATLRHDCKTNTLPSLPACTGNESAVADPEACCISGCKCVPPATPPVCTAKQILSCIRSNPRCERNEIPCFNQDQCCPSCNSFVWRARLEVVAQCLVNRRECEDGEDPAEVQGEPCQSCIVRRPVCPLECNETSLCVFDWDFGRDRPLQPLSPRCVPKKIIRFHMENATAVVGSVLSRLRSFNRTHYYWYLVSVVERYCSIPKNHAVCKAVKANIRNMVVELVGDLELLVTVAEDVYQQAEELGGSPLKRDLSATSSGSAVLTESLSDPAATDVTFSATATTPAPATNPPTDTNPPGSTPSHASYLVAPFLLVALCLSFLF
eukprot:TRINITY_DN5427_c0_g1_i1.p1 TRINITY_DN5427_c0_g1~~TRINITY_DN5427_c0_g1_i1.p1  ORF type:complete len:516 (+),score=50.22 TRINITY_DN5427_c0_g1_i1:47-1594(+)